MSTYGWMYTLKLVVKTSHKRRCLLLVVENGGISLPFEGTYPCHLAPESLLAWPGRAYWRIAGSSLAQALFLHEEWPRTGDGVEFR